ncbi:MAG: RNA degradosome polyphosphate kinase, partial [Alphaproteobacteria bacterium PA3]
MTASTETSTPKAVETPDATSRYFNREVSWLKFNRRVLEEAQNPNHPLLERLRFLSISGGNLDEFFMVRVAGLRGQQMRGIEEVSIDGLIPAQQLELIGKEADELMADQQVLWRQLRTEMASQGIRVVSGADVAQGDRAGLETYFREEIFPILTLQALDPAHPFPFIPNLGMSMIFDLERRSDEEEIRELIMIPATLPRFVRV